MAEYKITESDVWTHCASRGLRASTRKSYLDTLRHLGLNETFTEIDVYQALERVTNQNTRRKHILVLKALGVQGLKAPEELSRQYYLPTPDEYAFYKATFKYPERLDLMYWCGLRVSEATYDTHKLVGNVLSVQYQYGGLPAKSTGNIVIPTWFVEPFKAMPKWEGTVNKLSKDVFNHSKRTGIDIQCHGLRAAYSNRLVDAGISLKGLQQQMRHRNVSTTMKHYVQVNQSEVLNIVDRL